MARPALTRVSNLQVSPTTRNKNNGLYAPSLTTAQRDAIPATTVANGGMIYNSSNANFEVRQAGAWATLTTAPVATLTAPSLTTANAGAAVDGRIYYDLTTLKLTAGVNGAYASVYTSPLAQAGNLVVQSANANPAPSVNGEIYYNTNTFTLRTRIDDTWVNLNTSVTTASGDGLVDGSTPMIFPSGPKATVEVVNNQIAGFTYYDTTNNRVRCYANTQWKTVTLVTEP
jgi:hypothetical protein